MRNVNVTDATGLHVLREAWRQCQKKGIAFILSGAHTQPFLAMEKSGFLKSLEKENVFDPINGALNRSREIVTGEKN